MPVVTVQMWTGRSPTQKKELARAITEAMVQHAGAKPTNLHVIIQEVPKENWALAGVMGDERKD
jgi:4-oxalocrotonate tautomerase